MCECGSMRPGRDPTTRRIDDARIWGRLQVAPNRFYAPVDYEYVAIVETGARTGEYDRVANQRGRTGRRLVCGRIRPARHLLRGRNCRSDRSLHENKSENHGSP